MVDETKPPKGWHYCCVNTDGHTPKLWRDGKWRDVELADAHRIAREEAQPYVAEALERIAFWATSADAYHEWHRDDADADMPAWLTRQFLAMARGERPLPGSEGR